MTTRMPTHELSRLGVSIWLDDLSRSRIVSGDLAAIVKDLDVGGVTTNPAIFARSLRGAEYVDALDSLVRGGASASEAATALMVEDVRAAADVLRPVADRTGGVDGLVSIEVDPRLAQDCEGTLRAAAELWAQVDRPNIMIKIPATATSLPAITGALALGISVNVTLVFSQRDYDSVIAAWLTGLEQAADNGHDLSTIQSVASVFVSRIDATIDARLDALGTSAAAALRGRAAIANARLAHAKYAEALTSSRWVRLASRGAQVQRPLWASTGVKDPAYPDTMYVSELAIAGTVNTMPEHTLLAFADHGHVPDLPMDETLESAHAVVSGLGALGIDLEAALLDLQEAAVRNFTETWQDLLDTIEERRTPHP